MKASGARPPFTPGSLEGSLGFNIDRVALLFRRELLRSLAEFGITPEQLQIMAVLWEQDRPLTQNEVVGITLRDGPTVSRILERMVRNGWIRRSRDEYDKRVMLVGLSDQAIELWPRISVCINRHFRFVETVLAPKEKEQLITLLSRLRHRLEE